MPVKKPPIVKLPKQSVTDHRQQENTSHLSTEKPIKSEVVKKEVAHNFTEQSRNTVNQD